MTAPISPRSTSARTWRTVLVHGRSPVTESELLVQEPDIFTGKGRFEDVPLSDRACDNNEYNCFSYYTAMTEPLADWFISPSQRTPFGPHRNCYKKEGSFDRFLFWSSVPGRGWSIWQNKNDPGSYQNSRNGKFQYFQVSG